MFTRVPKAPAAKAQTPARSSPFVRTPSLKSLTRGLLDPPAYVSPGRSPPLQPYLARDVARHGLKGAGGELPHRTLMEHAFGTSFAGVRAHTGDAAVHSSRRLGATAYTVGQHVAFTGPSPPTELVAHELAHVVQQRAGKSPPGGLGHRGDPLEQEADAVARVVAGGGRTDIAARYPAQTGGGEAFAAVQRYEAGEHAILGCGPSYPFVLPKERIRLDNGVWVSPGELVAFGDFYAELDQIRRMPWQETTALLGFVRLDALWTQVRHLTGATDSVLADETDEAWTLWGSPAPESGQPLRDHRTKIFKEFEEVWRFFGVNLSQSTPPARVSNLIPAILTLGRRRFRGTNDALYDPGQPSSTRGSDKDVTHDPAGMGGDYLDLAMNNVSHFSPDNWETWKQHHAEAVRLHREGVERSDARMTHRALALAHFGAHFLTDRFSAGHLINKEQLMVSATDLAKHLATGHQIEGNDDHELISNLLSKALDGVFKDRSYNQGVNSGWNTGVAQARSRHLVGGLERFLMSKINRLGAVKPTPGVIKNVVMSLPWRNERPEPTTTPGERSTGPASQSKGAGQYQLGLGNIAALQVHDALNQIGIMVRNDAHSEWLLQGDTHMTRKTQEIAGEAVRRSIEQVQAGRQDLEKIRELLPESGHVHLPGLKAFLHKSPELLYDRECWAKLWDFAQHTEIPLGVEAVPKQPGRQALSQEMKDLSQHLLEVLLRAPRDQQGREHDADTHTGLNTYMLRDFLSRRLFEMVPMAYMVMSTSDLPPPALSAYAPYAGDKRLPRLADGFRWISGRRLTFTLHMDGSVPGNSYRLSAKVFTRRAFADYTPAGQEDRAGASFGGLLAGFTGARVEDAGGDRFWIDLDLPRGGNFTQIVLDVPNAGYFDYVMIYGDAHWRAPIGRSPIKSHP